MSNGLVKRSIWRKVYNPREGLDIPGLNSNGRQAAYGKAIFWFSLDMLDAGKRYKPKGRNLNGSVVSIRGILVNYK